MIRAGALLIAAALVCRVIDPTDRILFAVTITALAAGIVLLLCGREPWPRCCPHCPVYSRRRARALAGGRVEASALLAAAREEAEQARAVDVLEATGPLTRVEVLTDADRT